MNATQSTIRVFAIVCAFLLSQLAFADKAEELVAVQNAKQRWEERIVPPAVEAYVRQSEATHLKRFGPEQTKVILAEDRERILKASSWDALGRNVLISSYRRCDEEVLSLLLRAERKEPINPRDVDAIKPKLDQCQTALQTVMMEELSKKWGEFVTPPEQLMKRFKVLVPEEEKKN